jgi:Na+-translocating ferredoxin:NAD+ oxidoreductase RnfD subunit
VTVPAALSRSPGVPIRGIPYPVVLPSVRDPRLHLAVVIVSLQVIGQVAFDFRLSIAQILISVGTCAVLEVAIVFRQQRMLVWPASALLTGNGVAFVLRVPGTEHGDWWSLHGAWIFAATAGGGLLTKHLLRLRGGHVFNPSNIGLVVCFLALGPGRAEPLDFWWGPISASLALALAIIVVGGLVILSRLRLLVMAVSFWLAFVAAIAVVAATGHAMTARWHLGPVGGFHFWTVLATSPEILVFLFFMLTDPKTVPAGRRARVVFAVSVALLAALLIAPARTEFWAKVAVLGALAVVCAARPALAAFAPLIRPTPRRVAALVAAGLVAYAGALVAAGLPARPASAAARSVAQVTRLPRVVIRPSRGVDSKLDQQTAMQIARDVAVDLQRRRLPISRPRRITLWLEAGSGQGPVIVARLEGTSRGGGGRPGRQAQTVEVAQSRSGYSIARVRP